MPIHGFNSFYDRESMLEYLKTKDITTPTGVTCFDDHGDLQNISRTQMAREKVNALLGGIDHTNPKLTEFRMMELIAYAAFKNCFDQKDLSLIDNLAKRVGLTDNKPATLRSHSELNELVTLVKTNIIQNKPQDQFSINQILDKYYQNNRQLSPALEKIRQVNNAAWAKWEMPTDLKVIIQNLFLRIKPLTDEVVYLNELLKAKANHKLIGECKANCTAHAYTQLTGEPFDYAAIQTDPLKRYVHQILVTAQGSSYYTSERMKKRLDKLDHMNFSNALSLLVKAYQLSFLFQALSYNNAGLEKMKKNFDDKIADLSRKNRFFKLNIDVNKLRFDFNTIPQTFRDQLKPIDVKNTANSSQWSTITKVAVAGTLAIAFLSPFFLLLNSKLSSKTDPIITGQITDPTTTDHLQIRPEERPSGRNLTLNESDQNLFAHKVEHILPENNFVDQPANFTDTPPNIEIKPSVETGHNRVTQAEQNTETPSEPNKETRARNNSSDSVIKFLMGALIVPVIIRSALYAKDYLKHIMKAKAPIETSNSKQPDHHSHSPRQVEETSKQKNADGEKEQEKEKTKSPQGSQKNSPQKESGEKKNTVSREDRHVTPPKSEDVEKDSEEVEEESTDEEDISSKKEQNQTSQQLTSSRKEDSRPLEENLKEKSQDENEDMASKLEQEQSETSSQTNPKNEEKEQVKEKHKNNKPTESQESSQQGQKSSQRSSHGITIPKDKAPNVIDSYRAEEEVSSSGSEEEGEEDGESVTNDDSTDLNKKMTPLTFPTDSSNESTPSQTPSTTPRGGETSQTPGITNDRADSEKNNSGDETDNGEKISPRKELGGFEELGN